MNVFMNIPKHMVKMPDSTYLLIQFDIQVMCISNEVYTATNVSGN